MSIASLQIEILHSELGEEELIKSVAAEVANPREMAGLAELQMVPGGRDGEHRVRGAFVQHQPQRV